jgi:hypothetical protein
VNLTADVHERLPRWSLNARPSARAAGPRRLAVASCGFPNPGARLADARRTAYLAVRACRHILSLSLHRSGLSGARTRRRRTSDDDHEAEIEVGRCGEGKAPPRNQGTERAAARAVARWVFRATFASRSPLQIWSFAFRSSGASRTICSTPWTESRPAPAAHRVPEGGRAGPRRAGESELAVAAAGERAEAEKVEQRADQGTAIVSGSARKINRLHTDCVFHEGQAWRGRPRHSFPAPCQYRSASFSARNSRKSTPGHRCIQRRPADAMCIDRSCGVNK